MNLKGNPFFLTDEEESWVIKTLGAMSAKQKAGQLFCVMAAERGPSLEELRRLVSDYCVGGILYRPAPAQWLREQYAALDAVTQVPLLKAANLEEGGNGAVSDGTYFGWPMAVAATGEMDMARKQAEVCANEARSVGINWTFSPVTDINYNFRNPITHIRTYGSDPDKVLAYSLNAVKTFQENGIAACAKHFPGDGVDFRDQHLHPTYNSLSAKEWYATYGRNYKALIDAGLLSIMAAHICAPEVEIESDPTLGFENCMPATLSPTLLQKVLRGRLGFNGVITSDATIMTGFIQTMERRKAIPSAIMAGCDMLVFNVNFYEDYQYMLDGLNEGLLTEERLNEAVTRILALKAVNARFTEMPQIDPLNGLKQRECADKSITLVKNTRSIMPLSPREFPEVDLIMLGDDRTGEGEKLTDVFRSYMEDEGFRVRVPSLDEMRVKETAKLNWKHLRIHIANIGAISNNTAVRLFWGPMGAPDAPKFIQEENDIFISFANPYHLQDVPRVKTYINAYTNSRAAVKAVVEKLVGKSDFKGCSPVDAWCGLPDTRL